MKDTHKALYFAPTLANSPLLAALAALTWLRWSKTAARLGIGHVVVRRGTQPSRRDAARDAAPPAVVLELAGSEVIVRLMMCAVD